MAGYVLDVEFIYLSYFWPVHVNVDILLMYFSLVFFPFSDYPGSEFYMPTFRNTLSLPSSYVVKSYTTCKYGTECSETSAYKI
jgi:hypothetical protein